MTILLGPVRIDNIIVKKATINPSILSSSHKVLTIAIEHTNSDDMIYHGSCVFTADELLTIAQTLIK